jgi:hypothetical protein
VGRSHVADTDDSEIDFGFFHNKPHFNSENMVEKNVTVQYSDLFLIYQLFSGK